MSLRPGKLLLILLIPAVVYGGLKGFLYYKAKRTVDDIVTAAANQADIRYAEISTDLRGAVTVSGITVQPLGYSDAAAIDSVRIASDDPMFFFRGAQWEPGGAARPPSSLSFLVSGVSVPLSSDWIRGATANGGDAQLCAEGLKIDPAMLNRVGFSELSMDMDGFYRLQEAARTLEFGMNMEMHDIESVQVAATLADVDAQALANGALPALNLGGFSVAVRVFPEFGRKALKVCAAGTDLTVHAWGERLAEQALAQFEQQGLLLGEGLSNAVRTFYREWGEVKLVSAPPQPVGLLSLMFLPPEQLAGALGLALSVNGLPVPDTGFTWQGATAQNLSGLLGSEPPQSEGKAPPQPRRVIVRREYEPVAVADIGRYVDHQVHIKPRGQPLREGLLKRISNGEAEVEQSLHGGKYTVYVPLGDIESLKALIQREIGSLQ